MDETQRPVWEIPFPAVTVCPVNKLRASAFNFSAVYRSQCLGNNASTQQEEQIFLDLFVLCDKKGIDNSEDIFRNINTVESIEKFSPQMKDTIYSAEFRRKDLKTHFDFQPILTEEGLCFSFNMMQGSYFFRNGTILGDVIYLVNLISLTLVQLHSPAEFPRPAERSFRAPLRGSTALRVTPAEMATDADVRGGYSAQQRRCYFPDERRLAFFRLYSQSNCEIECLANLTLRHCGCVPFHMPQAFQDVDFRASGEGEGGAGAWWRRLGLGRERERAPRGERDRCSCLQTCAHLSYEGEASSFEGLAAPAPAAAPLGPAKEEDEFYTTVSINFKDTYFIPTRRIEMFGTIDFI
ncbi:Pickpocket, partial [Gryllus bimaculatus]